MSRSQTSKFWRKVVLPLTMFSALSSGQTPELYLFADEPDPRQDVSGEATLSDTDAPLSEGLFIETAADNLYDTILVGHPGRRLRGGGRQQDCEPECEETTTDDLYDKMLREEGSESDAPTTPDVPSDPSSTPPPSAQNFDFAPPTTSFVSTSRNVPAFIGDFFGGGGFFTATIPGQGIDIVGGLLSNSNFTGVVNGDGFVEFPATANGVLGTFLSQETAATINSGSYSPEIVGISRFELGTSAHNSVAFNQELTEIARDSLAGNPEGYYVQTGGLSVLNATNGDGLVASSDSDVYTIALAGEYVPLIDVQIPLSATAGRVKLSENSSPIPRDRILFNYSFFNNVGIAPGGVDVNRFTPGFEKTFLDGDGSVELRVPFATTLDSDITGGIFSSGTVEMGDVTATLKYILARTDNAALSAGFGMSVPTADSITYTLPSGAQVLRVNNNAVHIMPYVGGVYAPTQRFFTQGIVQVDTPVKDNAVDLNRDPNNLIGMTGLTRAGELMDPTFLYVDVSTGYWLYRADEWDMENKQGVTGVAGMFELHYNTTLNEFDQISAPLPNTDARFQIGDNVEFEQLNAVVGSVVEFSADTSLSFGYAVPLSTERIFEGEFRCNFTHLFGGSSQRSGAGYMMRNRSL